MSITIHTSPASQASLHHPPPSHPSRSSPSWAPWAIRQLQACFLICLCLEFSSNLSPLPWLSLNVAFSVTAALLPQPPASPNWLSCVVGLPLEYTFWLSVYLFHMLPGTASEWKHPEGRDSVCFAPHCISFAWRVLSGFGPSVTIPWLNGHYNSISLTVIVSLKWVNMCNAFTIEPGSTKSWTRVETE